MGLLYFFDRHIKPLMLRGTQDLHPCETGDLGHGVRAIRQGDVNLWFYTRNGVTIAVDAGHLNEPHTEEAFASVGIDPLSIRHVLLTHADVDHCGGIDAGAKQYLYPNAQVYLGEKEQPYLNHTLHRMVKAGRKIYNCVRLRPGVELLKDGQVLDLDGISVRCILVPGHTAGHLCYIVDGRVLFSGDCLAVNGNGGYGFWEFFCQYPEQNLKSLKHLREGRSSIPWSVPAPVIAASPQIWSTSLPISTPVPPSGGRSPLIPRPPGMYAEDKNTMSGFPGGSSSSRNFFIDYPMEIQKTPHKFPDCPSSHGREAIFKNLLIFD